MKIITGPRGSGITTELVKMSAELGIPILVPSEAQRKRCMEMASSLGCSFPPPYVVGEPIRTKAVIIDNASEVIGVLLGYTANVLDTYDGRRVTVEAIGDTY